MSETMDEYHRCSSAIESHLLYYSKRIIERIIVLKEKKFLEMILDHDFSCIYACSKMKAQILLDTPEVKTAGISAFRFMDDILGKF